MSFKTEISRSVVRHFEAMGLTIKPAALAFMTTIPDTFEYWPIDSPNPQRIAIGTGRKCYLTIDTNNPRALRAIYEKVRDIPAAVGLEIFGIVGDWILHEADSGDDWLTVVFDEVPS